MNFFMRKLLLIVRKVTVHDFVKYSVEYLPPLLENLPYLFDVRHFENYIDSQLHQLFNDTGTDFGKGVYFARDASFSVGYANRSQAGVGNRCMYVAKVLVGQYCKGTNRQAVIPPPKDPSKPEELFDSVVNDSGNPSIFVVFFDSQCYPEYLIKF